VSPERALSEITLENFVAKNQPHLDRAAGAREAVNAGPLGHGYILALLDAAIETAVRLGCEVSSRVGASSGQFIGESIDGPSAMKRNYRGVLVQRDPIGTDTIIIFH
jgi:hypothetical protein